jgi:hypothetical protein
MTEAEPPDALSMEKGTGPDTLVPNGAESEKKRLRWLRFGLVCLLVIIALGITASFLSSASTARLDQMPHTYLGVGAATTTNYVEIDARVGQITPSGRSPWRSSRCSSW